MTTPDFQDCHIPDAPAFTRLAERITSGEDAYRAIDHLTPQQMNYAARVCGGCRPLAPWIEDQSAGVAAARILAMVDGLGIS